MEKLIVDFARQIVFFGPAKLSSQIKNLEKRFIRILLIEKGRKTKKSNCEKKKKKTFKVRFNEKFKMIRLFSVRPMEDDR